MKKVYVKVNVDFDSDGNMVPETDYLGGRHGLRDRQDSRLQPARSAWGHQRRRRTLAYCAYRANGQYLYYDMLPPKRWFVAAKRLNTAAFSSILAYGGYRCADATRCLARRTIRNCSALSGKLSGKYGPGAVSAGECFPPAARPFSSRRRAGPVRSSGPGGSRGRGRAGSSSTRGPRRPPKAHVQREPAAQALRRSVRGFYEWDAAKTKYLFPPAAGALPLPCGPVRRIRRRAPVCGADNGRQRLGGTCIPACR